MAESLTPDSGGARRRSVSFESLEPTALSPERARACEGIATHRVTIAVGSWAIEVRFSHGAAAAAFAERYADMLASGPPRLVVFAVALDDEALFWAVPERVRRWPEPASDDLVAFFADNVAIHEFLVTSGCVGIHAAVVTRGERLLALAGPSLAGKTTTALAAVRDGFELYSDERCIIEDGLVVPFPRGVTLRAGGRAALLADPVPGSAIDARLRALSEAGEIAQRPSTLAGARALPPRPLAALFIIEGRGATPTVEPLPTYAAVPALLKSMVSDRDGLERMAQLIDCIRTVPFFRLRLGTPRATALAIAATIDEFLDRTRG